MINSSQKMYSSDTKPTISAPGVLSKTATGAFAVFFALLSIFVTLGITGCSSNDGEVVAVVNGDAIPLDDLETQMRMAQVQYFPSYERELQARKIIVDTLVIQQLLVQEGYKRHLDELEDVARIALSNKEKFLLDVLYEREIGDDIEVTDAEIQRHFDNLEYKYRASHILVKEREQAQALIDSLENGAPFGRLAYNQSLDRNSAKDNGDLGYFVWGQMDNNFMNAVLQMAPGDVSSPVKTRFGWHVIKLAEKMQNAERTTLNQMRYAIKQDIIGRKRSERIQDYYDRIAQKYPVTIEKRTTEFLMKKREDLYPPLALERLPKNDFDMEQLDRDERALTLATWDGGQLSLGEYLTQSQKFPREIRPDFDETEKLADFIFRMKFNDILSYEARRLGLESSDEFNRKMKRFKELAMAEIMKDSLPQPPPPDEQQLMNYYNEHLDQFSTPAKVHLFEILVSDKQQAEQVLKGVKSLNKFRDIAAEVTERGGKRASRGDLGYIERKFFEDIFDAAQQVPVGGFGGPIPTLGKWSVFYVADKRVEEVKSYDAVKRDVNNIVTQKQKADAFAKWANSVKADADITIYSEVISESIDRDKYTDTTSAGM